MTTQLETRMAEEDDTQEEVEDTEPPKPYRREIVWRNVFLFLYLHVMAACGLYAAIFHAKRDTNLFALLGLMLSGLGSSAGAHRLWCHRSYKAKLPLRIFLMLCNCVSLQNNIYAWTRDHRLHHKYSDTDADPHNISRGFFFAHMGWLLCKKHPEVLRKGKTIDCSDVLQDPVVVFQKKYYVPLVSLFCFGLSIWLPQLLYGETFWNSLLVAAMLRYVASLHVTWLVNSAAHCWGYRPYDRHIAPVENPALSFVAFGEGFHNYHHAFPYDYSSSELGWKLNFSTKFINLMAMIGQAYDLKTASKECVDKRVQRTGDESKRYAKLLTS